MNIHYLGLSEINGPLIFLDHVKEAGFEEMVEIKMSNGSVRHGRVVQVEGEKVAIQVFEGTHDISLSNTKIKMTGHPVEMALSKEILGRIFNGSGQPIDGLGDVYVDEKETLTAIHLTQFHVFIQETISKRVFHQSML